MASEAIRYILKRMNAATHKDTFERYLEDILSGKNPKVSSEILRKRLQEAEKARLQMEINWIAAFDFRKATGGGRITT